MAWRNGGGATGEVLAEIDYAKLWINRTITR
jgi:environmental stress-induced protein Ves